MFCPNCGKQLQPTDFACSNCGTVVSAAPAPKARNARSYPAPGAYGAPNPYPAPNAYTAPNPYAATGLMQPKQRKKWPWFVGGGVLLAAVVAVVLIVFVFGSSGGYDTWQEVAQLAGKAFVEDDFEAMNKLTPADVLKLEEARYPGSTQLLLSRHEATVAELRDEYGSYTISVQIGDTLPYSRQALIEKLTDREYFDTDKRCQEVLDFSKLEEGVGAEVRIYVAGSNGKSDSEGSEMLFVKYDGGWYVVDILG